MGRTRIPRGADRSDRIITCRGRQPFAAASPRARACVVIVARKRRAGERLVAELVRFLAGDVTMPAPATPRSRPRRPSAASTSSHQLLRCVLDAHPHRARAAVPRRRIDHRRQLAARVYRRPDHGRLHASKGALFAPTRGAAIELARDNVRVNAVAPGLTATPLFDAWVDAQEDSEGFAADIAKDHSPGPGCNARGGGGCRRLPRSRRVRARHRRLDPHRQRVHGCLIGQAAPSRSAARRNRSASRIATARKGRSRQASKRGSSRSAKCARTAASA